MFIDKGKKYSRFSFSQCGEDLIAAFIFNAAQMDLISYIDVGAHHPYYINNTAYFYRNGCKGINIEPDPALYKAFPHERPKDINLNIGINTFSGTADFYIMSTPTMNTFSFEEAKDLENNHGFKIKKVKKIPVDTLPNIITKYHHGIFPDFLSLDVEGLDLKILESIEYTDNTPKVVCVETMTYSTTGHGMKSLDIIDFLKDMGYMVYADTYINTIFVKRSFWER
jgi:FkbM family methyltransferase